MARLRTTVAAEVPKRRTLTVYAAIAAHANRNLAHFDEILRLHRSGCSSRPRARSILKSVCVRLAGDPPRIFSLSRFNKATYKIRLLTADASPPGTALGLALWGATRLGRREMRIDSLVETSLCPASRLGQGKSSDVVCRAIRATVRAKRCGECSCRGLGAEKCSRPSLPLR